MNGATLPLPLIFLKLFSDPGFLTVVFRVKGELSFQFVPLYRFCYRVGFSWHLASRITACHDLAREGERERSAGREESSAEKC